MTVTYQALNDQQKRQVRTYGCSVDEMREAVEESLTHRFSGPAMYVIGMLSDAQEMVAHGPRDSDTLANIMEDQRQLLNRAKWILDNYLVKK
jgi:hypothetical protein